MYFISTSMPKVLPVGNGWPRPWPILDANTQKKCTWYIKVTLNLLLTSKHHEKCLFYINAKQHFQISSLRLTQSWVLPFPHFTVPDTTIPKTNPDFNIKTYFLEWSQVQVSDESPTGDISEQEHPSNFHNNNWGRQATSSQLFTKMPTNTTLLQPRTQWYLKGAEYGVKLSKLSGMNRDRHLLPHWGDHNGYVNCLFLEKRTEIVRPRRNNLSSAMQWVIGRSKR